MYSLRAISNGYQMAGYGQQPPGGCLLTGNSVLGLRGTWAIGVSLHAADVTFVDA